MGEHDQPPSDQNRSKKSNFTCTLEHDQPPSDQKIRSKPIKKKSNFTCSLDHNQPPSDQKIRSKPIKKKSISTCTQHHHAHLLNVACDYLSLETHNHNFDICKPFQQIHQENLKSYKDKFSICLTSLSYFAL